jgi:hypothetical protein
MGVAADHTERPEIKLQAAQAYRIASATMIRLVHRHRAIGDPARVECWKRKPVKVCVELGVADEPLGPKPPSRNLAGRAPCLSRTRT